MIDRCRFCGRQIVFRHEGGQVRPIHIEGGGWCEGYESRPKPLQGIRTFRFAFESHNFCHPTKCPKCKRRCFFIRHNDGSVWVDKLGWPWPKHECFLETHAKAIDTGGRPIRNGDPFGGLSSAAKQTINPFASHASEKYQGWIFGVVERAAIEGKHTLIALRCSHDVRLCVTLAGRFGELLGQVMVGQLDLEATLFRLEDHAGNSLSIRNARLDPTLLELPADWCADNKPPAELLHERPPEPATPTLVLDEKPKRRASTTPSAKLQRASAVKRTGGTKPKRKTLAKGWRPLSSKPVGKPPLGSAYTPRSASTPPPRQLISCPKCTSLVRADRLERHLRRIHGTQPVGQGGV